MAVTADLLLCVSTNNTSKINISNVDATKFPDRSFDIPGDGNVSIDASSLEWSNYFKSGLRGATELLRKNSRRQNTFRSVGMDILVNGTVPSGGGISSSAAFVCASALAVLKANGEDTVDKKELVELAIVSERAVGVNSGGYVHDLSLELLLITSLEWTKLPRSFRCVEMPSMFLSSPVSRLGQLAFPRLTQK
jgi:galactokinase